nr:right-handed parallel beta-helix repeat-containing protein [Candidatus Sigynarchaeota archaeon]
QAVDNGAGNRWCQDYFGNYWQDYTSRYPGATPLFGIFWSMAYTIPGSAGSSDVYPLLDQTADPYSCHVFIDGNADLQRLATSGDGSESTPYIIENLTIQPYWHNAAGIHIQHTNAHFILQNCYVGSTDSGYSCILLLNVTNAQIIDVVANRSAQYGIEILNSNGNVFTNNLMDSNYYGFYSETSYDNFFISNTIRNNMLAGLYIDSSNNNTIRDNFIISSNGNGILLLSSNNNTILANYIADCTMDGICLDGSNMVHIINNTVYWSNGVNIHVQTSTTGTTITNNSITYGRNDGIGLESCFGITIENNTIEYNRRHGLFIDHSSTCILHNNSLKQNMKNGIFLLDSDGCIIDENTVRNSIRGVILESVTNISVSGNTATYNTYGFYVNASSNNLTFSANIANRNTDGMYITQSWDMDVFGIFARLNNRYGIHIMNVFDMQLIGITAESNSDYGCYVISSTNVSVSNATLYNNDRGLQVDGSTRIRYIGGTITRNIIGIQLVGSMNCIIANVSFIENFANGVRVETSRGNVIENNTLVTNYDDGIYIGTSNDTEVRGNTVTMSTNGIRVESSLNTTIEDNVLAGNYQDGINMLGSDNSTIRNNTAEENLNAGIYLDGSTWNVVENNTFFNNTMYGIEAEMLTDYNQLVRNVAGWNQVGIYLSIASFNNVSWNILHGNDVCITQQGCTGNVVANNDCDNRPVLGDENLAPYNGNILTNFTFTVVYSHADNISPAYVRMILGGTPYEMVKLDDGDVNYTDGCLYVLVTTLPAGSYNHRFEASDGTYAVRNPWEGVFSGPGVSVNVPPSLSSGSVAPGSGTTLTLFTFSVIYTEAANRSPVYVRAVINGVNYAMWKKDVGDTTYSDGCTYIYLATLLEGNYTYHFQTTNGVFTARLPTSGELVGPSVSLYVNAAPSLTGGTVSPATGTTSTFYVFSTVYSDANNEAPSFVRVHVNGTVFYMTKQDPWDMNYTDGCIYEYTTPLPVGDHEFHFEASDGLAGARLPITG